MQETVDSYKAQIQIMQEVKRVYKKDGSDFQSYLKNFDTGEKVKIYYEYDDCIKLYSRMTGNSESVSLWYIKSHKDFVEEVRKTQPERIIKSDWKVDRVKLTPDEFMQEIKDNIEWRQQRIEFLESIINKSNELLGDLI